MVRAVVTGSRFTFLSLLKPLKDVMGDVIET
jgi:hypothetical protein